MTLHPSSYAAKTHAAECKQSEKREVQWQHLALHLVLTILKGPAPPHLCTVILQLVSYSQLWVYKFGERYADMRYACFECMERIECEYLWHDVAVVNSPAETPDC